MRFPFPFKQISIRQTLLILCGLICAVGFAVLPLWLIGKVETEQAAQRQAELEARPEPVTPPPAIAMPLAEPPAVILILPTRLQMMQAASFLTAHMEQLAEQIRQQTARREKSCASLPDDAPRIVLIIDDIGMDVRRSRQTLELPAPVTLALLPYAPGIAEMAEAARGKGHELIVHMPMAAEDASVNPGPGALIPGLSDADFIARLKANLDAFPGYDGINNHMGSLLTQDRHAMDMVMGELAARRLFFVDSRTINTSVAPEAARAAGVPNASRDVFLDHDESYGAVVKALQKTEAITRHKGLAIAIGHPKDNTLKALHEWLPSLCGKGFRLAKAGEAVE